MKNTWRPKTGETATAVDFSLGLKNIRGLGCKGKFEKINLENNV